MSIPVTIKTEEVILGTVDYNSAEELDDELQLQLEDSGGESYHIQYSEPEIHRRHQSIQKGVNMSGVDKNLSGTGGGGVNNGGKTSNDADKNALETEKRMRREIANSNERRRMQSINAGFQNLRSLLPRHEGEKLSKAAILQQTSSYICELEGQKTHLLSQNSQLKRLLGQHEPGSGGGGGGEVISCTTISGETITGVANKKRKLTADNIFNIQTISDSSDEGLGSMSPEPMTLLNNNGPSSSSKSQIILAHNAATKEILDLKKQLDKERRIRTMLEDELQMIKRQLYSVATARQPSSSSSYIPREVIEHTDNLVRDTIDDLPAGTVSYVEIDEMTGQPQVVVCSSIEELESEAAAAADEIITEDHVHEEVILSSSTESEQEVNAIAKAYAAGGSSPSPSVLQPILQAAIKATPKVEVEHINDPMVKVKTEKIEQPGLTRSRQNLETIVEAIRHLEGDHLFGEVNEQQKLQSHHNQQQKAQEAPLALTNKHQQHAQRATIAELRPYLQLKGNKQVTIVGGGGASVTLTQQQLAKSATAVSLKAAQQQPKESVTPSATVTPTAIFKVQTNAPAATVGGVNVSNSGGVTTQHITITSSALKQCRPGVIVAKQS